MKQKYRKALIGVLVLALVLFQTGPGLTWITEGMCKKASAKPAELSESQSLNVTEQAAEKDTITNEENTIQYLIRTEDRETYRQVYDKYGEELTEDYAEQEGLKDSLLLTADLSQEEAASLRKMEGVTVERDVILRGSSEGEELLDEEEQKAYQEAVLKTVEEKWDVLAVHGENVPASGAGIRVAVMDSGQDTIGDIAYRGYENLLDPEGDPAGEDMTGHGTAVASIIASGQYGRGTIGILEKDTPVQLFSVKVLDGENEAPVSRIVAGIQWCIDQDINIINMSFGTPYYSAILEDAIREAEKAGILMIAAVGNGGERGQGVEYPAAFEEVLGVGSVNEKMEHSIFSSTGEQVELSAPGENVPVSIYWDFLTVDSGTSYAAPHVTAIAALLWSRDESKDSRFIRGLLDKSARSLGEPEEYGYGLVDYRYADRMYEEYERVY